MELKHYKGHEIGIYYDLLIVPYGIETIVF